MKFHCSEPEVPEPIVKPSVRQLPVSYIKAFAYQPVAFPTPLGPIATYQVSKNGNQYSNGNSQYLKSASPFQQFFQGRNSMSNLYSQYQNDYPTSVSQTEIFPETTTTTPVPGKLWEIFKI